MNAPISAAPRRLYDRPLPKPGTKRWKKFAKWAKAEFAPAPAEELARLAPPSNDEWDQMKNPYLVSLRIAYRMAQLDKEAASAALKALTKEQALDHLVACVDRFRCFAELADDAIERLLCAAGKTELERMEAEERT
jgi:uncharacterized protein YeaO (DUF488 family)